jgi:iron(III) transport system ATP-binding protein
MAARYPHELSGGEQQRVALARALAPRPIAILLDEPFSHLDRNLRTEVRQHTVEVLRDDGATGVFVTHDQEEAMVAADRVAILRSGRIQQIGSPREVFHAPTSRFVATFLGDADFLPGLRSGTRVDTVLGPLPVTEAGSGSCQVMVRPHDLTIDEDENGPALVERVEFYGAVLVHHVLLHDGSRVRAMSPHTERVEAGARVRVRPLLAHRLIAFPSPGEA